MANAHFESVLRVRDGKRNWQEGGESAGVAGGGSDGNAFIMFK